MIFSWNWAKYLFLYYSATFELNTMDFWMHDALQLTASIVKTLLIPSRIQTYLGNKAKKFGVG